MSMLNVAKSLVAKGVSVIPVGRPDGKGQKKLPWIEWAEYQKRLPTQEELEEWWGKHPEWQIAIVTGKVSNLAVVDVDTRHGGKTNGLPPTLVAKTQSGGWHFYYRYLEGLRNAAGVRQGVDIRSDGGYVVAPPSVGSMGKYEWANVEEPQPFPADVLKVEVAKTDWSKVAGGVGEGGRNQTAAQYIGKLLKSFKPDEWESAVWLTVLNWNRANKPPLPESELRATFNSIVSREKRKEPEEGPDAPVVLLSEAVKQFTTDTTGKHSTGFKVFDQATNGGLTDGDLVLVVGQTGEGKTTFAQTLTYNLLGEQTHSVWFSFEVMLPELWEKFKSMGLEDGVPIYTPEKYAQYTIKWIKKKIIEARDTYKCKMVFIDHLGFLIGEYEGSGEKGMQNLSPNMASVYGMICRDLKKIAIQEGLIIVLLWHTRRLKDNKTEATGDDIKDSSAVLQEADLAVSVARERLKTKRTFSTEAVEDVFGPKTFVKMLKNRRTGVLKRFRCSLEGGRIVEDEEAKSLSEMEDNFKSW